LGHSFSTVKLAPRYDARKIKCPTAKPGDALFSEVIKAIIGAGILFLCDKETNLSPPILQTRGGTFPAASANRKTVVPDLMGRFAIDDAAKLCYQTAKVPLPDEKAYEGSAFNT
jgi:hypothetical protein